MRFCYKRNLMHYFFFLSCKENSDWDRIEISQFINKSFAVPSVPVEEVLCFRLFNSWDAADPSLSLLGSPSSLFSYIFTFTTKISLMVCTFFPTVAHTQTAPVSSSCLNKPFSASLEPLLSLKSPTFPLKVPVSARTKPRGSFPLCGFATAF